MAEEIEVVVRIGEDGSDRRRIDWLTAELRDLLDGEPGCMARHAGRLSDRASPKGSLEIIPGAITLVLTVAANLRVVAALLAQWVHRNDFKHMWVSDTEHGVEMEFTGMGVAQIEAVLAAWKAGGNGDGEA
jgi:hypothetical protein